MLAALGAPAAQAGPRAGPGVARGRSGGPAPLPKTAFVGFRIGRMEDRSSEIHLIALLEEPTRLRLYEYVRSRPDAVGRDEAAAAVGISRSLAAFHLDRLVDAGLLSVEYRRLSGRSGRGAGRPAKLYRPSGARVSLSLPETRYELAGRILADALEERGEGEDAEATVRRVAGRAGEELGERVRERIGARKAAPLDLAREVLEELGFQPERRDREVLLRNCPFHQLVQTHPDLVCAMNHALLLGLIAGLGSSGVTAVPRRDPDYCCVAIVEAR